MIQIQRSIACQSCTGSIELSAGDVIEVLGFQNSGSTQSVGSNVALRSNFSGFKIGSGGGAGSDDNLGDHTATQGVVFHKVTGAAAPTK